MAIKRGWGTRAGVEARPRCPSREENVRRRQQLPGHPDCQRLGRQAAPPPRPLAWHQPSLPPPPFARRAQASRGRAPAPAGPRRPQLALRRARPSGPTAPPPPSCPELTVSGEEGARGTGRDSRSAPGASRGRPEPRRGGGRGGRRGRAPPQEGGSRRSEAAPRGRGGGPRCHGSAAPAEGLSGRRRAAGRGRERPAAGPRREGKGLKRGGRTGLALSGSPAGAARRRVWA